MFKQIKGILMDGDASLQIAEEFKYMDKLVRTDNLRLAKKLSNNSRERLYDDEPPQFPAIILARKM